MSSIVNKCINGNCSNCGDCCTDLIPISSKELKRIKSYVKKYKIKESLRIIPTKVLSSADLICPFRDNINNKCKIYEVRPRICREFKCDRNQKRLMRNRDALLRQCKVVNLHKEIYDNDQIKIFIESCKREN